MTNKSKMAFNRSYDHTHELLADVQQKAETARVTAIAKKEEARKNAANALEAVRDALVTANNLKESLSQCPKKPKGFEADMEIMTGNLQGLEGEIGAIEELYGAEIFAQTTSEAEVLRQQVDTLTTDLESAHQKLGCPIQSTEIEPAAAD